MSCGTKVVGLMFFVGRSVYKKHKNTCSIRQ